MEKPLLHVRLHLGSLFLHNRKRFARFFFFDDYEIRHVCEPARDVVRVGEVVVNIGADETMRTGDPVLLV